jgi:hypothetical protein
VEQAKKKGVINWAKKPDEAEGSNIDDDEVRFNPHLPAQNVPDYQLR